MLLIFIAALTGCDDNVNDHFALPQTNPQEPVQNVEGFTLSLGSSCTAPILFKDLDDATLLEVAKLTDHPELTEGDTINLEVEVSKDETFTQAVPLPCSVKNGTASVTAGELVNPEKPDVPINKNDAFQKVQKRRVQEKR